MAVKSAPAKIPNINQNNNTIRNKINAWRPPRFVPRRKTPVKKPAIIACIAFLLLTAFAAAESDFTRVKLETDKGDITLELNREKAPKTVDNFLSYVKVGFYDGTLFHRRLASHECENHRGDERLAKSRQGKSRHEEFGM